MSLASLYEHILHLDSVLTGKSHSEVAHNLRHQAHLFNDMERFAYLREIYYLSDGGCSRVYMTDDGELLLTQNSLDKVKAKWETAEGIEARERFVEAVRALIPDSGPSNPGASPKR